MKHLRGAGSLRQLSWTAAILVLLPLGLGLLLDRLLSAAPLYFLAGALLGVIAGTIGVVRTSTRAIAELERSRQEQEDRTAGKEDNAS